MIYSHKIYLASSWRNKEQPETVEMLRSWGHDVYDFRHPADDNDGFHWSEIDPNWESWTVKEYRRALRDPVAVEGYRLDFEALQWADIVVLLLPSGASAHSEAAWHRGQGKVVLVYSPVQCQPELMYKMFNMIVATPGELNADLCMSLEQLQKMSV